MKYILARAQTEIVKRFAGARLLVAFAFDGTLAPLVVARSEAALRPSTRALLHQVTQRYPCAVVSSRRRADVISRLSGLPFRWVVGGHGSEREGEAGPEQLATVARVAAAREELAQKLGSHVGIEVENRGLSLSLHYGGARDKEAARLAIADAVFASWPGARILGGKQVVHVLPAGAVDKRDAVDWLRQKAAVDRVLYVGDDLTDEDVFERQSPEIVCGVRVQKSSRTAAPYYLCHQGEMDDLLARLAELRPLPSGGDGP